MYDLGESKYLITNKNSLDCFLIFFQSHVGKDQSDRKEKTESGKRERWKRRDNPQARFRAEEDLGLTSQFGKTLKPNLGVKLFSNFNPLIFNLL